MIGTASSRPIPARPVAIKGLIKCDFHHPVKAAPSHPAALSHVIYHNVVKTKSVVPPRRSGCGHPLWQNLQKWYQIPLSNAMTEGRWVKIVRLHEKCGRTIFAHGRCAPPAVAAATGELAKEMGGWPSWPRLKNCVFVGFLGQVGQVGHDGHDGQGFHNSGRRGGGGSSVVCSGVDWRKAPDGTTVGVNIGLYAEERFGAAERALGKASGDRTAKKADPRLGAGGKLL